MTAFVRRVPRAGVRATPSATAEARLSIDDAPIACVRCAGVYAMPDSRRRAPTRAKGKRETFEAAAVAWIDLLGYGSMLRDASFDPRDKRALDAVERLRLFHRTITKHAHRLFPVTAMNDGAVLYRDLSPRAVSVTFDFLQRAIAVHARVNQLEHDRGFPGARMVVATGVRMRVSGQVKSQGHLDNILLRLKEREIDAVRAGHEAFRARPIAGIVPELQANFAFTKAFLADHSGSKAGLAGPASFVDMSLFADPPPSWIRFRRLVEWSTPGMSARFGEVEGIDGAAAGAARYAGLLDTASLLRPFVPD